MRKRTKKNLIRSGTCPCCKCFDGISQFNSETYKQVSNLCTNCFMSSSIINGRVVFEHHAEWGKAWKVRNIQPLSNETKRFLFDIGVSQERIEELVEERRN